MWLLLLSMNRQDYVLVSAVVKTQNLVCLHKGFLCYAMYQMEAINNDNKAEGFKLTDRAKNIIE